MLQYLNYFGEKIMSRKRKTFNAEFKSKVVLIMPLKSKTTI
jgi:hypothetical protein